MKNKLMMKFLACFGIAFLFNQVNAQNMDKNSPLAMETILKQGTEYDSIKPLIGKWSVKMTIYKKNSTEILSETAAQLERKMIGNFLQETMKPAGENDPNPFERISYLSYNRVNKRWEYSVFDTRFPLAMNEQSVEHDIKNNAITVYLDNFALPPMWGDQYAGRLTKQRRVITFGKDENTNHQFMTLPGEEEFLAIKYVFARMK